MTHVFVFRRLLRLLGILILFCAPLARAHDPFVAEIKADADAGTLAIRITFARSVAAHLAGLTDGPRLHYAPERFEADRQAFVAAAASLCLLEQNGRPLAPERPGAAALIDEGADIAFTLVYPRPASATPLRFSSPWIFRLPTAENYVATFALREGDDLLAGPLLVSGESPVVEFTLPRPPGAAETTSAETPSATAADPAPSVEQPRVSAFGFFKLGVEHILTGYDHLLYLAALILGCTGLRAIVGIVTAFTVSHSITLALATLGLVTPPSALVEQIIAASIVFVAVENLWLRGRDARFRHVIAFAFGLVHGFGFVGLLAELGVGAEHGAVVVPLLSFNLGVEVGQLLVIAIALPLLLRARRNTAFVKYAQPSASVAVAGMGLIWLCQRF